MNTVGALVTLKGIIDIHNDHNLILNAVFDMLSSFTLI